MATRTVSSLYIYIYEEIKLIKYTLEKKNKKGERALVRGCSETLHTLYWESSPKPTDLK